MRMRCAYHWKLLLKFRFDHFPGSVDGLKACLQILYRMNQTDCKVRISCGSGSTEKLAKKQENAREYSHVTKVGDVAEPRGKS